MPGVGELVLKLSASATGMASGLKAAESAVSAATGKMADMLKSGLSRAMDVGSAVGGYLEKVYKDPVKAFTADVVGNLAMLAKKVPLAGSILALPLEAIQGGMNFLLDTYKAGVDRVKDLGAAAARVSVPVDQFQVLEKIAGSSEAAEKAINKLHKSIADASLAAEGARTPFTALGLDARELASKSVLDQWGMLGDALQKVGNTALAVRASFEILGKSGPSQLQALMRGSAAVKDMAAEMDKFGVTLSQGVLFSIKQAGMAKKQIEMLKEGFSNQVVMAMAPVLAEVSSQIGKLPMGFKGLSSTIVDVMEQAAKGVALFIDALRDAEVRFAVLDAAGAKFAQVMLKAIATVIDALPGVSDAIGAVFGKKVGALVGFGLGMQFGSITKGLRESADKQGQAFDEAQKRLKGLGAEGKTPAFDWVDARFRSIKDRMAAVNTNVGQVDDTFQIFERGLRLQETLVSPLEKARDALAEIQALSSRRFTAFTLPAWAGGLTPGVGMLDLFFPGLAEKGAFKAFQEMRSAVGLGQQTRFTGTMEQGSREAYSTIIRAQENRQVNIQQEIKAILQAQKEIEAEHLRVGREVLDAVRKNGLELKGM